MVAIVVPTYRRAEPGDEQVVWGDLRVLLASILAYAPEAEVIVGWDGDQEPRDLPNNPRMRLLQRPGHFTTASEGFNWCVDQTEEEDIVISGDDCVLHPMSIRHLLEDAAVLSAQAGFRVGFVAARSNYVKGLQNIRSANGGTLSGMAFDSESTIFEAPSVSPIVGWIKRDVYKEVGGFPHGNWFSDDVMCWDLARLGYRHFVSRAYVHHIGERGTGQGKSSQQLLDEGLAWLRESRPDFLTQVLGIPA